MDQNTHFSSWRSLSKPGFLSPKIVGCMALALLQLPMLAPTTRAAEAPWAGTSSALTIWNFSNEAIYRIYLSPADSDSWGVDRLGTNILPVDDSFLLYGITPGLWDIKVVDAHGKVRYWMNVQIYDGYDYTLYVDPYGWETQAGLDLSLPVASTKIEA